jgi:hypothetical protein
MSKILIVSKTKMSDKYVCIGGIDLTELISVRLLDRCGYHEFRDSCPYEINEIWDIDYIHSPRLLPHSEDVRVLSRKKIGILKQELSIFEILNRNNFKIYTGHIKETFERKLKCTISGAFFISEDNIPQSSTCFWICDREIIRKDYQNKIRYNYCSKLEYHSITYVGLDENPPLLIPEGTLMRLSLAYWWSPQDSEDKKKCYLQLSGWY